jgi:hypothetical protein
VARNDKSSGLTVIDVIVLLCVLGLSLAFLSLFRRSSFDLRMKCGPNLWLIGRAMLLYANDHDAKLPCAGGRGFSWAAHTPDWKAADRQSAFGLLPDGTGGQASISASLYLLIRYGEVSPKTFLCPADKRVRAFDPARYRIRDRGLTGVWDFGPNPSRHCSYAYQMVYGTYTLTTSSEPGFAIAADRNPWLDSPSARARDFSRFQPDLPGHKGTWEQARSGNAVAHKQDGQNVLFLDSHVEFACTSYCALDDDNIYTISGNPTTGDPLGTPAKLGSQPASRKDSLLVNDPPASRK